MLLGVILHEYAHGYIAYKSGDPTAKSMGRLSLNPMAHIDLFGSIFLPLLLILLRSNIVFGYAKPVPINPAYFRNFRKGIRYTSLAGPLTNLMVAFILGSLYGLFVYVLSLMLNISVIDFLTDSLSSTVMSIINRMFISAISINIFLAIFNFIPIPPLDGSKILASFLPGDTMIRFLALERLGFIFIFILLFLGGRVFWSILSPIFRFLLNLCLWWQYILA
ncbi:MAG: site-2 protease family protein [Actinobacteria bacterium]|nr:site-2 protease family protein [Actinomycetota bacterium]